MRLYFVLRVVIFVSQLMSCVVSHKIFGSGLNIDESSVIIKILRSSYAMCYKACISRKQCIAFELNVQTQLCRLLSVDTTESGVSLVRKPGTVFSEKRNWIVTTPNQACTDNCMDEETCSTETDPPQCSREECAHPSLVDAASTIMGNMKSNGSRILHVCNFDMSNKASSICRNGTWSPATLACFPGCTTSIPNGALTNKRNTSLLATSPYTCDSGYSANATEVTCQATGQWGPGMCIYVPDCGTSISNGQLTDISNTTYGASTAYTCSPGYQANDTIVTCLASGQWGSGTCNIIDCGTSISNGQLTDLFITIYGASTAYTCSPGYYADETNVTCQATGQWGPGKCYPLASDLGGQSFRIIAIGNDKWWHYDPSVPQKRVTVMWQPTDNFVKFVFEATTGTGVYKFKSVANGLYMWDGGDFLNTLQNPDDDTQRFIVYRETNTEYRILTKATGKYVRVNEDRYVSSIQNKKDDFSLFKLESA